ncbi:hypothetical protein PoB_006955400 [Plakobranchus ocellatus]|uniref:Uncharacterized protein n=1 Tax=Plakobranchus ocellatus TaxID=259542 RepID=A0AAV4DG79_9GAST|nr:hypothetical protein PoB_006955400 [Plakobranchus ocellatus]
MDSALEYATSHRVVNPNSLGPPRSVDSALSASAPAFCDPESSQPAYASSCQVLNPNGLDPRYGVDSAPEYATSHRVVNPYSLDPPQKRLMVNGLDPPGVLFTVNGLDPLVVLLTVNGLDPPEFLLTVNSWECSQQNPPLPDQGIKGLTTGIQHFAKAMPTIHTSAVLPPAF